MIACKPNFEYGTARLRSQRRAKFDPAIRKIWNLLEIVKEINVKDLTEALQWIEVNRLMFEGSPKDQKINRSEKKAGAGHLRRMAVVCEKMGFRESVSTIQEAIEWFDGQESEGAVLAAHLAHVQATINARMPYVRFFILANDRLKYYDNLEIFGDQVVSKFPSAKFDITEALNCLALERNTAAVFHLMRVAEWGMRALAADLGVKGVPKNRKAVSKAAVASLPPTRTKYTPIEFSEWEKILQELSNSVAQKMQNTKRGSKKQALQEFYYPVLQDIQAIKDAYRNHVMHTRRVYSQEDADAVLSHVLRIMKVLATKVSEV